MSKTNKDSKRLRFGKNPKHYLGTHRGLIEYLIRRIGISPSCIVSEHVFSRGVLNVTVTQVKWRQCVGHIYKSTDKGVYEDPRNFDPLFLDHVLVFFDTRQDVSCNGTTYDTQLQDMFVQFGMGENAQILSLEELEKIWISRPRENLSGGTYFKMWYGWTVLMQHEVFGSKIHPKDLGDQLKNAFEQRVYYTSADVSSENVVKSKTHSFAIHPRISARESRERILKSLLSKAADVHALETQISHLQKQLRGLSENKWNK